MLTTDHMVGKTSALSLLSIAAGALLTLAFAPFGYYYLAELALSILILIETQADSPKLNFWYGWLFGLGLFGCGVYWIFISLYTFGHAHVILAGLILGLLVAFMALYPALQSYLLVKLCPKTTWAKWLLVFPSSWVLFEWLRGWILSGFPWLFLGYSHLEAPIRGLAPIIGSYGLSFVVAQTAGALALLVLKPRPFKALVATIALGLSIWVLGYLSINLTWTQRGPKPLVASIVQGNIALARKWNEQETLPIIASYHALTQQTPTSNLVIWPEAAIPTFKELVQPELQKLAATAHKQGRTIISGIPSYNSQTGAFYNSMIALGKHQGVYHKRHLVPFGEFVPCPAWLDWLRQYVEIPMSSFTPGPRRQPELVVDGLIIAPFVCYEIAYSNLVLDYLPRANLLVTVCEDSWFGESTAAAQHLEIARMRSLESGRYQLLSTNTGITAIIDHQGQLVAQLPPFTAGVVTRTIYPYTGATPWVRLATYLNKPWNLLRKSLGAS